MSSLEPAEDGGGERLEQETAPRRWEWAIRKEGSVPVLEEVTWALLSRRVEDWAVRSQSSKDQPAVEAWLENPASP